MYSDKEADCPALGSGTDGAAQGVSESGVPAGHALWPQWLLRVYSGHDCGPHIISIDAVGTLHPPMHTVCKDLHLITGVLLMPTQHMGTVVAAQAHL